MMWVLLQSELPWQCNDAITFFYLSLCLSVPGVFLEIAEGSMYPP